MMLRELFLIGTIILFAGCSSKEENRMNRSFGKVSDFGAGMQKTENIRLSEDGEVKIFLTGTYLNSEESIADKDKKVKEKFIVGLYQTDDVNLTGLINADQNLTINIKYPKSDKKFTKAEKIERNKGIDRLPITVRKLSLNDPLLKNIPLVNTWNSYYYVEFPHTERKKFTLTYQNKVYGKKKKKKSKKKKDKKDKTKKNKSKNEKKATEQDTKTKQEKNKKDKAKKGKDEKAEKQEYKKYKLKFSKKAKYLYQKSKNLF